MKQFIYVSSFASGQEATKKQQKHFETDVAYALESGYEFIQDANGTTFQIISATELVEVDVTEEDLAALHNATAQLAEAIEDAMSDDSDSDYCIHCHNLQLIDQVINNTLKQATNITPQQADTMLKLAQLRLMLNGGE